MRHAMPGTIMRAAWRTGLVAAVASLLGGLPAHAQQPPPATSPSQPSTGGTADSGFAAGASQQVSEPGIGPLFGSPFGSDHLFGDWGGLRTRLEARGININLDYLTENGGNITGGRRETFATDGQIGLEINLDLDKLLGWQGAAFHSIIVNREGRNLSADSIGDDLATVQEIYGGGGNVLAHMVYAYGEESLLRNRLDLIAGWLPVGNFFAASPLYCDFMNVLFCGNPHPLPNYPGEDDWPQATFGSQARVLFTPQVYLQLGLFSVDPDYGTGGGGSSGFAWADPRKSGVSIPVELGWVPVFGRQHLIGHYKVGYDRDTHRYADVLNNTRGLPQASDGGTFASQDRDDYYVLLDQMLVRQGSGPTDGIIVFGGWVHATDQISPLTQHAFAAATTTGAPWGRPKDTLGASFQWIEMSGAFTRAEEITLEQGQSLPITIDNFGPAYGPQNTEQTVELTYVAHVFRGVTLQPDFQYIIRPGATTNTPDAAVLGFRTNINF